jgi:hypothetical protein
MLVNKFDSFLDDIYIGERTHRLYFEDDERGETTIDREYIYPVICKKYSILLQHDYKAIDATTIATVQQTYKRRIERFNTYLARDDIDICMVYSNIDFHLNSWQSSVYTQSGIDVSCLQHDNRMYIDKIQELYKDRKNITIVSLEDISDV